jgi:hypothetical protein
MEDRKLDACVAYIDVTTRVFDLSLRLARTHGLPTNSGPIELELGLNQLTEAAIERSQCWYRLRLVADPAAIAASRDWQHTVWEVEKYARGDLSDQTKFREAVDHARRARANFHETARRSLGIKDEEPLEETSPVQQQSAATALSSIDPPSPDSGG